MEWRLGGQDKGKSMMRDKQQSKLKKKKPHGKLLL